MSFAPWLISAAPAVLSRLPEPVPNVTSVGFDPIVVPNASFGFSEPWKATSCFSAGHITARRMPSSLSRNSNASSISHEVHCCFSEKACALPPAASHVGAAQLYGVRSSILPLPAPPPAGFSTWPPATVWHTTVPVLALVSASVPHHRICCGLGTASSPTLEPFSYQ